MVGLQEIYNLLTWRDNRLPLWLAANQGSGYDLLTKDCYFTYSRLWKAALFVFQERTEV